MVVRARWIHQYFYWCALRDSIVVNFQYFDHNPFTRRNIFIFVVVRTTQKLNRIYGVHYSRQTVRALWISNEPTNPNKLQIELCACLTSLIFFWTIFDSLQPQPISIRFPFRSVCLWLNRMTASTSLWCQSFLYWIVLKIKSEY